MDNFFFAFSLRCTFSCLIDIKCGIKHLQLSHDYHILHSLRFQVYSTFVSFIAHDETFYESSSQNCFQNKSFNEIIEPCKYIVQIALVEQSVKREYEK
ncbi:MAG TPA: hypothetical protein VFY77_01505 [Nitrososphaeraceae archaeon]|nr:hypothetical protein [Nitrososphaeraceae archaeon]